MTFCHHGTRRGVDYKQKNYNIMKLIDKIILAGWNLNITCQTKRKFRSKSFKEGPEEDVEVYFYSFFHLGAT